MIDINYFVTFLFAKIPVSILGTVLFEQRQSIQRDHLFTKHMIYYFVLFGAEWKEIYKKIWKASNVWHHWFPNRWSNYIQYEMLTTSIKNWNLFFGDQSPFSTLYLCLPIHWIDMKFSLINYQLTKAENWKKHLKSFSEFMRSNRKMWT